MNKNSLNFWLDIALIVLLLVALLSLLPGEVQRSARSTSAIRAWYLVHEISGALMLVVSIFHLILHWDWIKAVLLERKSRLAQKVRRNRTTDLWLFVTATPCTLTGVMFWPLPGIWPVPIGLLPYEWRELHNWIGTLLAVLLGVHLALHWKWIVNAVRRLFSVGIGNPAKRN